MLPELHSKVSINQTKPHSTSQQSDFLPEEVLFALTQPPHSKEKHGPPIRGRNIITTPSVSRPPPASVWNYRRRSRFKHLLDHTPCICGAGKDISFLYDVPHTVPHTQKSDPWDQSHVRKNDEAEFTKVLVLPDSINPEEYYIVNNKGVTGIQYHEDKYSTQPLDHEKHLAAFPSMNPTSRYEVIQLRNTFESMMKKVEINELETDAVGGPTQMHMLLKLIKKEQNIYNIVFNELIRQATVECAERGELLHLVWNKYYELLNKIPELIMSLHEEVIAQRALDIRLTDELMRFKGTIGTLTSELTDVKEHDKKVTKEAQKAQEDLRSALTESQKNASLLIEYHDLYELQRQRLERQVFMLMEEREIWSTAAFSLAVKVTEDYKLNTAKRLQLLENSWMKLANHFTILLSDRDTDLLTKIQGHIEKWRDLLEDINMTLKQREESMRDSIKIIQVEVESYLTVFNNKYIALDNEVAEIPDEDFTRSLTASVKSWLQLVVKETDAFSGVMLLNSREAFSQIRREIEEWTDSALKMFGRHCSSESKEHPYHSSMIALNKEIDMFLIQLYDRATGESGTANLIIHLQSSLETWETHLMSSKLGTFVFQESEWGNLYRALKEWLSQLNQAIEYTYTAMNFENRNDVQLHPSSVVHDVIRNTQRWITKASNSIDSEDAKLVEQVSSLHSEMVRWMIQFLLRLTPDKENNSQEAAEMSLLGSASIQQLIEAANTLFESLETFSNYLALCCDGIVTEETLKRQDDSEENADYEMNDLKRLRTECVNWIQTAQMLISQLTGKSIEQLFPTMTSAAISEDSVTFLERDTLQIMANEILETEEEVCKEPEKSKTDQEISEMSTSEIDYKATTEADSAKQENPNLLPHTDAQQDAQNSSKFKIEDEVRIEVLGVDANTHRHPIEGKHIQLLDQQTTELGTGGSPDVRKAFESLAVVKTLQDQLIATEERAQLAEERASHAEAEIVALEERIRVLEKKLEKQSDQVDLLLTSGSAAVHSKSLSGATAAIKLSGMSALMTGTDVKEEKSGKKSGKSSAKSSKRN